MHNVFYEVHRLLSKLCLDRQFPGLTALPEHNILIIRKMQFSVIYPHLTFCDTRGEQIMTTTTVSIGQVKRDVSELVNRVAYGRERIVLTSRGKPKAVLISVEEFERLKQQDQQAKLEQHRTWMNEVDQHVQQILARREGKMIDADVILEASRADLEERNDFLFQR